MSETAVQNRTDPWIAFYGEVGRIQRIGHSLVRVTCTGADFADFADTGYDQRVKLILPLPEHGFSTLPAGEDWYLRWRQLPVEQQNPIRTYTVRAVRPEAAEVDIDLVLHGTNGPASAWAATVALGDQVAILGPNARFDGDHGGIEFRTPAPGTAVLLAGDETAQPAIARILEQLPAETTGVALLEMPHQLDAIDLAKPAGVDLHWLIRGDRTVGEPMLAAFTEHAAAIFGRSPAADSSPISGEVPEPFVTEDGLIWDVSEARVADDGAATGYAWIAGEAGMVKQLRRILVRDYGADRSAVSFMGYWRL